MRIARGFHDLFGILSFLMPAVQLLGSAVLFLARSIFYKPALHGGVVAWHQDYSLLDQDKASWPISLLDRALIDSTRAMAAFIPYRAAIIGTCFRVTGLADDRYAIQIRSCLKEQKD